MFGCRTYIVAQQDYQFRAVIADSKSSKIWSNIIIFSLSDSRCVSQASAWKITHAAPTHACFTIVIPSSDQTSVALQVGMAGATRKANFAGPIRGTYTGVGAARTANRPAAELGNWSTTYTNSYEVRPCFILLPPLCDPPMLLVNWFCLCF